MAVAWLWPAAAAAVECRWSVESWVADAPHVSWHQLRVGEVVRPLPLPLQRVRNQGPHDIRLSFDGAAPRVLQRGQSEPAQGSLPPAVRLTQVECLATRAPTAAAAATAPRLAAARHIDEHRT
jgi:hypothetical protein